MNNSEIELNDQGYYNIHELTQTEVAEANKFSPQIANVNEILEKIVTCLDQLIDMNKLEQNSQELSKQAENLYFHAVHVLDKEWSTKLENVTCASLFKKMAVISRKYMVNFEASIKFYRHELAINRKTLPAGHAHLTLPIKNIGLIYNEQELYDKALESFTEALDIDREFLPPRHPYLGTTIHNIGQVYYKQSLLDEALVNYSDCLEIHREQLEPDEETIAKVLNSMGAAYQVQGAYQDALDNFKACLTLAK